MSVSETSYTTIIEPTLKWGGGGGKGGGGRGEGGGGGRGGKVKWAERKEWTIESSIIDMSDSQLTGSEIVPLSFEIGIEGQLKMLREAYKVGVYRRRIINHTPWSVVGRYI